MAELTEPSPTKEEKIGGRSRIWVGDDRRSAFEGLEEIGITSIMHELFETEFKRRSADTINTLFLLPFLFMLVHF